MATEQLRIEFSHGCVHVGRKEQKSNAESQHAKEHPTDKGKVQLEQLPFVTVHHFFAFGDGLVCTVALVQHQVEHLTVSKGFDQSADDLPDEGDQVPKENVQRSQNRSAQGTAVAFETAENFAKFGVFRIWRYLGRLGWPFCRSSG